MLQHNRDNMYTCSICSKTFKRLVYFRNHKKTHDENKKPNIYECNKCSYKTKRINYYRNHMKKKHPVKISSNDYNYISKYMKTSLFDSSNNNDPIISINGIPQVVYLCWFSHKDYLPHFSFKRMNALKSLISNIGVPVIILTTENYKAFEVKDYPIHEAFNYLTGVHKADYLRCYMLHHYGGGYHDIKFRDSGWENEWDKFDGENTWILGKREERASSVGYPPGQKHIQKYFNKLCSMCWIICKPKTPFTTELLSTIHKILDKHLPELKKHPGPVPRGCYSDTPFSPAPKDSYPLRWLEILGEIFHPLMLKYNNHIKFGLSGGIKKSYK